MQPDPETGKTIDLDRYVPALLSRLAGRMAIAASRECRAAAGLGFTDWRVMAQIALDPNSSAVRLCLRSGLDKGAVSRSFAALEARGLVQLQACGRDRRATLSPAGEHVHARLLALSLARERRMLAGFCENETATLRRLLRRMVDNLVMPDAGDEPSREPQTRPVRTRQEA